MPKTYRVALIGCGGIARLHARSITDLPEAELVALADIRPEAINQFGDTYDIPTDRRFTDYSVLLDAVRPDIAIVATRADTHAEITIAALDRGINVLCEKPIAVDLREADAMIEASARSGAKLAINTQRHTDPVFLHAKRLVSEGAVGDLRAIRSECKTYTAAVGMMNIGSHLFDAMNLIGGSPHWVFADLTAREGKPIAADDITTGDRGTGLAAGDIGTVLIGYNGGVTGISEYWEGVGAYGFEVVGTRAILAIRGTDPVLYRTTGGGGKVNEPIVWDTVDVPLSSEDRRVFDANRWGTQFMMRDLIRAIENNEQPSCSGYAGRSAMEINHAAFVSARTGSRVLLPLQDREHPQKSWIR
jgi:predicted dehydrogenase